MILLLTCRRRQLSVTGQFINSIFAVKRGCIGRHAATCTYEEIGFYLEVHHRLGPFPGPRAES